MSVLVSSRCHYCRRKSETEDHIVPQTMLPRPLSQLPYWFRQYFTVPSCKLCNGAKQHFRSDCNCEQCVWVWNVALACFATKPEPPTVCVAEARLELQRKIKQNSRRREGSTRRRKVVQ